MTRSVLRFAVLYAVILVASHAVRWMSEAPEDQPLPLHGKRAAIPETRDGEPTGRDIKIAYLEWNEAGADAPVVVCLHGSPGDASTFASLVPLMRERYRLIVPDLPGFRCSTHEIADYSTRAHGFAVIALLDKLGVENAHIVGYSMGGGVALEMVRIAPDRWSSLVLMSSIGVQELELLGDYTLNHAVHGLQLAGLWLIQEGVPHFGWMDGAWINVAYARNFFDTDQRPFREILAQLEEPVLILHGEQDPLVPFAAAREHYRLVPQSELVSFPKEGHMTIFTNPEMFSSPMIAFLNDVAEGRATLRSNADSQRIALAREPFSRHRPKRRSTGTVVFFMVLLALATLVSEDLTCISAGLLVARGGMGFLPAALGCFLGIFVGDMMLYVAGRWLGRPALKRVPLKWILNADRVDASARFFQDKGPALIFTTRFVPGTRLPTYFAAGMFHAPFLKFTGWFALAAIVWTPLLVALSWMLGGSLLTLFERYERFSMLGILAVVFLVWIAVKLIVPTFSHRGRRMLIGAWRRKTRWEFWPMWVFYPPVVAYIVFLGLRHRCLTLFTAANPGIPAGGVVLESKREILDAFHGHVAVADYTVLEPGDRSPMHQQLKNFMLRNDLNYPVVLKPDVGERGAGVKVVRSDDGAADYFLAAPEEPIIAQRFVSGREFGVFYFRYPNQERGKILSITDKRFIDVTGDGKRSIEELILDDERAVCMAPYFFGHFGEALNRIPAEGERVPLTEVGTHCRGALFLDGSRHITEDLTTAIDALSREFDGFFFGRYDIRGPSEEELQQGKNLHILEVNGVTSESTNIYDPSHTLLHAYRTLFRQWRIAFEIGAENRRLGAKVTGMRELVRLYLEYKDRPKS